MILADILCIFHTTGQTCAFSNSLQKRTKSCSGYSLMILIKGCKWPWSAWHSDTVNHSGGIVAHSGIVAYCTDFPHLAAGLGANAHLYSTIIYSYHRCLHVWVLSTLFSIYSLMLPAHILYTLQFRLFSGVNVKAHILATFKYVLALLIFTPSEYLPSFGRFSHLKMMLGRGLESCSRKMTQQSKMPETLAMIIVWSSYQSSHMSIYQSMQTFLNHTTVWYYLVRFPNPHYVVGWGTEPLQRG